MINGKAFPMGGFRLLALCALLIAAALPLDGCGGNDQQVVDDVTMPDAGQEVQPEVVPEESTDTVPEPPAVQDFASMAPQEYGIEDVFFAFDVYTLSDEAMALLEGDARIMKEHPEIVYLIEGHCDERGTVEYNLALGEKRAAAVRDYLVSLGVPKGNLKVTSYGEERPFAYGSDESAWALNRRAHFARP